MPENAQDKLDRVRPPRVQIKYEVNINGAMEKKELPFVMGVLGDFSGKPAEGDLEPLAERDFIEIDHDQFDTVLAGMKPRLAFNVEDKLSSESGKQLAVELKFRSMDDFSPANVARQIEPLKALLDQRERLMNLLSDLDGNNRLQEMLNQLQTNPEQAKELRALLERPTKSE